MKTFATIILVGLVCMGGFTFLLVREFGRFIDDACPYGRKGEQDGDD